ncbi:hypothetical protein E3T55_10000 [Cryobacterium frigoriphilum]|uniref:Transcription factor zinc-finger domain-containing protein n=1 Tax=Cryobacterium frigoriphilum TaxID=1259150 RepID=A0A4R9A1D9_9MICO|nr:zf-TFIIB domain-containing protein [Cryobacterium frigoriphilum]TFD50229.1 hypothetical protein E3T55_10000 [Cryobacterium frigoriphilum]
MKCPTDGATLVMSERAGVEIDYCPECRGVWLDRGELDKILDRAAKEFASSAPAQPATPAAPTQSAAPVIVAVPQQQYPDARTRAPQYGDRDRDRGYGDRDRDRDRNYGDRDRDRDRDGRDGYRPKKKEHWLGELFG